MEEWKYIKGYDKKYQISNLGRVKSSKRKHLEPEKILSQLKIKNGYMSVHLSYKGKDKRELIHRLIAQYFIPNPDNKPQVNHINGIKTDNRIENLEWCTQSENQIHAVKLGLQKTGAGVRVGKNKQVIKLYRAGRQISEIANKLKIGETTVNRILTENIIRDRQNILAGKEKEVLLKYNELKSYRKTAEYFECSTQPIIKIIKEKNR